MRYLIMMAAGALANFVLTHWSIGPEWLATLALAIGLYGFAMCLVRDFAEQAAKGWHQAKMAEAKRHAEKMAKALQAQLSDFFDGLEEDEIEELLSDKPKNEAPKQEINPEGVKH